jgi:hypothetical protein
MKTEKAIKKKSSDKPYGVAQKNVKKKLSVHKTMSTAMPMKEPATTAHKITLYTLNQK